MSVLKPFTPFEYKTAGQLNHAIETTAKYLDLAFKETISFYPENIRKTLEEYYFEKQTIKNGLLSKEGCFGTARVSYRFSEKKPQEILVKIDADVAKTKLFSRLVLLHEVGGHLGQMLQMLQDKGPLKYDAIALYL